MPKFTADLTNNLRGGIQVLLKRDRLHSRTCLATHSGDIRRVIMNSKQSFGTRNFAGGTWNQCDDLPLTEALWELLQKYGWSKFISSVDQCKSRRLEINKPTTKKTSNKLLTHKRVHHPIARHRFDQVMDVFDPMFEPVGANNAEQEKYARERKERFWNQLGDHRSTYAEAMLYMCEQTLRHWRKHWDSERDGASKEDEALKEIEIDPRMNNVTSKVLN